MYGICIYFFIHPRMEACFVKIRVLDQMCSQRILIDHVHELCMVHLIKMQKFNFTHMPILLTPKTAVERQRRPDRLRAMLVCLLSYRLLCSIACLVNDEKEQNGDTHNSW